MKSAGPPSAVAIFPNSSAALPLAHGLVAALPCRLPILRNATRHRASPRTASARHHRAVLRAPRHAGIGQPRAISTALPAVVPNTSFMSVITAWVFNPAILRSLDDAAGKFFCPVRAVHERAIADLHIHDERLESRRDLLRQDRRRDQRDGFDRARYVAYRIEPAVGRCEIRGLADDRAADVLDDCGVNVSKSGAVL